MTSFSKSKYNKIVLYLDKIVYPNTYKEIIIKMNEFKPKD